MIAYEDVEVTLETSEELRSLATKIAELRQEGPLDPVSLAKLQEHFRASHVYHSAGIEGNRLTLQETLLVLKEGLDISGKPLKDSVEVKHLGEAFDYLKDLADREQTVREADVRNLHCLLTGEDREVSPGAYRKVGVIISGSEHRPPEPLEVPSRMEGLVKWINSNLDKDPIMVGTVAHHELAAIHPFKDGNGRVSRLLMNLLLMKRGYPICNIRREDRPEYYEALSFGDIGIYEPLMKLVIARCADLVSEYDRIRTETKRTAEWAARWGDKETQVLRRRESREMELWQSRVRQVFLEFQKASELLSDELEKIEISFYDYKSKGQITFEQYQELSEKGFTEHANAFSITFRQKSDQRTERFMFRYHRNFEKFPPRLQRTRVIPLELNYFDRDRTGYVRLSDLQWARVIRLRELYFTPEGDLMVRYYSPEKDREDVRKGGTIAEAVQWFFDDVLNHVFHLRL